ncbi:MAG: putative methylated-DNA--protein-cysteine methyltransferase [Conexibacter sp.]|nr:putative methylated-DNA--protein-cysteine methyltransferase [Conexibacter sp.]
MSKPTRWTIYESPFGPLALEASARGLRGLHFPGDGGHLHVRDRRPLAHASGILADAATQLAAYFAGERVAFELELDLGGTRFQRDVWEQLAQIPYATTISYTELAQRVGRPDRVRAAGGAVARTPVPIVVPCHRVVAVNGALTGYRGGLERKRALLDLEARGAAGLPPEPTRAFRQLALP